MNAADLIPVVLLIMLALSLASATGMFFLISQWRRRHRIGLDRVADEDSTLFSHAARPHPFLSHRPMSWLAVRSRNLRAVQAALRLTNPKPCTWTECLAGEQKLFIAPPVNGWILIVGTGLPDPCDDVDACFLFLLDLSRQLGQVQFFLANRILGHHAWVRAESGRVNRAYAWAGETLWNQGLKTEAERQLGLNCFEYLETPDYLPFGQPSSIASNTEKVPLLAAHWSLDPASIDERVLTHASGVAGDLRRI